MELRVAGENLLDQGSSGPGQTEDKHGLPGWQASVRESLEQGRLPRLDQLGDETFVLRRIVNQVSPLEVGECEGIRLACALGRFRRIAGARPRRSPGRSKG